MKRLATLVFLSLLGACASAPRGGIEPPAPPSRYTPEPGRDAATVAEMRAAPAPAVPDLAAGRNPGGDHRALAAQGFVRIGSAHFAGPEAAARDEAIREGREVGAERVLLYPPRADAAAPAGPGDWAAAYYVRFQLPFGATFRDLRAQERAALASTGGVAIGSVIGGTPASRANLISGDLVLALDGQPFADRSAFQALLKRHAGHAVTLTIVRNGERLKRMVRLGAMPANSD